MSDHISGPRALADPIADITDVYAFPSPEQPDHLVLVDEHAAVRQALRPVLGRPGLPLPAATTQPADAGRHRAPFVAGDDEFVFDCVFSDPGSRAADVPVAGGHLHHPDRASRSRSG